MSDDDNIIKLQKNSVYGDMKNTTAYQMMKERLQKEDTNSTPSLIDRLLTDYEYEESHGRDEWEFNFNIPEIVIISCCMEQRIEQIHEALNKETNEGLRELLRRYLRIHQLTYLEFRSVLDKDAGESE